MNKQEYIAIVEKNYRGCVTDLLQSPLMFIFEKHKRDIRHGRHAMFYMFSNPNKCFYFNGKEYGENLRYSGQNIKGAWSIL